MTPKELHFAELVANGNSYADAYRGAFDVGRGVKALSVGRAAHLVAKKPHVAAKIFELQTEVAKKFKLTREWLVTWHLMRATYDAGELSRLVQGSCRYCHGEGHQYHWRQHEYLDALTKAERRSEPLPDIAGGFGFTQTDPPHPECPHCHGIGENVTVFGDTDELSPSARAAFEGIKQTREGFEVRMADKHAAAVELARLCGFHVEQLRVGGMDVPGDEALANLSAIELAQTYKRIMGTALQ